MWIYGLLLCRIFLKEEKLISNADSINLNTNKTIFVNGRQDDFTGNHEEAMRIRGKLQLVNDEADNSLLFGNNISIVEAKKDGDSIGMNFIVS